MATTFTNAQCVFIVRKLAAFEPPRSIAIDFAAQFRGQRCTEDDVRRLAPAAGAVLSPELHALYWKTREEVKSDPTAATFADQQARLIALSKQVDFYIGNNDLATARNVMRQIAEEVGAIGNKAGAKVPAAGVAGEPEIVEITRTIIDPPPKKETAQ